MSVTYEVRRSLAGADDWTVVATDLSEPSLRDSGLVVDTAYDYQVRACNAAGCSEWSTSVTVTPIDIRYDVRQSLAGQNDWTVIATDLTDTAYLATELLPNTEYDFQVRACYLGACSDWSTVATETTDEATGTPVELAARGGLLLGGRARLVTPKRLSARGGFILGGRAALQAGVPSVELSARGGLILGGRAQLRVTRNLSARGGLILGGRASIQTVPEINLAAIAYIGISATASLRQINILRAIAQIGVGGMASLQQDHNLRALARIGVGGQDRYNGPGTGLVVGDPSSTDITELVNRLREGDDVPVLLSWGGSEAMSGYIRVLGRGTTGETDRQSIEPWFQPTPDPELTATLARGGNPAVTPQHSGNLFREMREQARRIRQQRDRR